MKPKFITKGNSHMKRTLKQIFAYTLTLCFIFVFASSVGAVDSISDVIEDYKSSQESLIVYNHDTNTETSIPFTEITDYSSVTTTTYDILALSNVSIQPIADSLLVSQNNTIAPQAIINPDYGFLPHAPLTASGTPVTPYSGVVAILTEVYKEDNSIEKSVTTGFLVAPRIVITAAHCVSISDNYNIKSLRIYPFTHQEDFPDTTGNDYYIITTISRHSSFKSFEETPQYDWAILTLNAPINNAYYFPCSTALENIMSNTAISVAGYPNHDSTCYLYNSIGLPVACDNYMVFHTANTYFGSSGSPIIGPNNICYGVQTGNAKDSNGEPIANYGMRFTEDFYNSICNKIAAIS